MLEASYSLLSRGEAEEMDEECRYQERSHASEQQQQDSHPERLRPFKSRVIAGPGGAEEGGG